MNKILENLYIGESEDSNDFGITQEKLYITFNLEGWKIDVEGLTGEDVFFLCHLAELIEEARTMAPVLIHCHAGIDRSPFAVACYLVIEHGFEWTDAYEFVKEKRPQTIIHDDWMRSFFNAWAELYTDDLKTEEKMV